MSNKPDIELTQNSFWVCDEDHWYIHESPGNYEIASDGLTLCITSFVDDIETNFIVDAHDVLAVLDKDGALDEYLKNRHSK